ncbi:MAG: rRNA maturation RNase YbeY [Firmicutes bacterium]|nr:rRNA maturation RNase YbeY [Bacillota bacterium]
MSADCLVLTEWDIEGIPETEAWDNLFHKTVEAVLTEEGVDTPAEVEINIVDDEAIREMNASYRDLDSATDVLSFPLLTMAPGEAGSAVSEAEPDPETGRVLLGNIVISWDHVQAQAAEYGHSLQREAAFLTAHSMLHLLGYDHETEEQETEMFSKQEKILSDKLGLSRDEEDGKQVTG